MPKVALEWADDDETRHSVQGVQYAVPGYVYLLQEAQVQINMATQGKPTENAYIEQFMHPLKEEVSLHEYQDLKDAQVYIARFLNLVSMPNEFTHPSAICHLLNVKLAGWLSMLKLLKILSKFRDPLQPSLNRLHRNKIPLQSSN